MMKLLLGIVGLAILCSATTTTISGNLQFADTTPSVGCTITIAGPNTPHATTPDGQEVVPGQLKVSIASNGNYSFVLQPNDTLTPSNTTYTALYSCLSGQVRHPETWKVTTSVTPLTIPQIIVGTVTPVGTTIPPSQITAFGTSKGDLLASNGSAWASFHGGSDGQVMVKDATQPYGLKWATIPGIGSTVTTFIGRVGDVTAMVDDYSAYYSLVGHNHDGVYEPVITPGTTLQYLRGDKSISSFSADAISAVTWSALTGKPSTFPPSGHASSHQFGGLDPLATITPGANAIPQAGSGGTLADGWLASNIVRTGDSRLSDARTPTTHAASHQNGGSDEVASSTAAANAIPKAGSGGKLSQSWVDFTGYQTIAGSFPWSQLTGVPSFAAVATSGSYADLSNKPTIPAAQVASDWTAVSGVAQILHQPTLGGAALLNVGSTTSTVAAGDDSRLSNARTPTSHASTHQNGGVDEVATSTAAANAIPKADATGKLGSAWIPAPTSSTLGGIQSLALASHNFVSSITTAGAAVATRPACADLSDASSSCSTDATNASNLATGTVPSGRIPNPTSSSLGGIQSFALVSHNFVSSISTLGVASATRPACADLSDAAASCSTDATNGSNLSTGTVPIARIPTGQTGTTVPFGNDARFTDSRTPTAHNLLSTAHGDSTASSAVRGGAMFAVGASPTWTQVAHSSANGGYWKWNGTDVVASTLAAAGTGSCTNQVVTAGVADAAPTCTTITSSYVDASIAKTGTDVNTSNQVTVTHLASALPVNQGGFGLATLTLHALYVGNGTTAPNAVGLGTTTTVLHGNATGDPTFGAVSLTADVSGVTPLANGGTNGTDAADNGGVIYSNASGYKILAHTATAGLPLLSGASAAPSWGPAPSSQKWFGTAAPGSVTGNLPGDLFFDTTNHNGYYCNATAATAAPACTTVATGAWTLLSSGGGGGGTTPYASTITAQTTTTITAVTHGVGVYANARCFDSTSGTGNQVECSWSRNSSGDIVFTWAPAFTGSVVIYGGGGGSGTLTSSSFTGGLITIASATTTPALTVAGTSGGVTYFSSSSTWASSGAMAAGQFMMGGGAGSAPTTTFSLVPVANAGLGVDIHSTAGIVRTGSPFTSSELSGDVLTSGSNAATLAAKFKVRSCVISIGDPGAGSTALANDNDAPVACPNDFGSDWTITTVSCYADAGTPTVTPILTGGTGTSILTGALTCGTASWAAGTVQSTPPVVHTFSGTGATCSSTPCSADVNITAAGGTAKYIIVKIVGTI